MLTVRVMIMTAATALLVAVCIALYIWAKRQDDKVDDAADVRDLEELVDEMRNRLFR
jgi:hypothetical protein